MYEAACAAQRLAGSIFDASSPHAINPRDALLASIPPPTSAIESHILEGLIARAAIEAHQSVIRQAAPVSLAARGAELLRQRYAERWTIESLARALGTNRCTLTSEFRAAFGVGVHRYLVGVRVRAAQDRLGPNGDKIETIAREIGFAGRKALYTAYKRVTGHALSEDRRQR
jgi:AraC-like DNA-binding protein